MIDSSQIDRGRERERHLMATRFERETTRRRRTEAQDAKAYEESPSKFAKRKFCQSRPPPGPFTPLSFSLFLSGWRKK
jgi:hypothetical protein